MRRNSAKRRLSRRKSWVLRATRSAFRAARTFLPAPGSAPDVVDVIGSVAAGGAKAVLVVPVGFICDHVEVLFDLDIEAREAAEAAGLRFYRAPTVGTHPAFIGMLSDLVRAKMTGS